VATCVPVLFLWSDPAILPLMPFEIPHHELSDAEIAAVFRDIITGAGRYPRHIELCFASVSVDHLVGGLRLAGLSVIRPAPLRHTE
jgi:hypothetical protein